MIQLFVDLVLCVLFLIFVCAFIFVCVLYFIFVCVQLFVDLIVVFRVAEVFEGVEVVIWWWWCDECILYSAPPLVRMGWFVVVPSLFGRRLI
jgi:hypothetical protein